MALFGDQLRKMREYRHFSLRQLAKAADVPYETIARLESGAHNSPRFDVAVRLAKALGVSLDYFTKESDPESDSETASTALVGA